MADAEKKYAPTLRRREQARREGRFAYSPDLMSATLFVAGTAGLLVTLTPIFNYLKQLILESLQLTILPAPTPDQIFRTGSLVLGRLLTVSAPFFGLVLATAVLAHFSQRRFFWASNREWPDPKQISPGEGLLRLLSWRNLLRQTFNLVKGALICALIYFFLKKQFTLILQLPYGTLDMQTQQIGQLLRSLLFRLAALLVVIGGLDYFWQYRQFEQSLWLTEQEMRDEQKDA